MSVVTSIRDYIDVLNTQIGAREDPMSAFSMILETVPQILKMGKDTLWYFFSFKPLRDNFYQPYLGNVDFFDGASYYSLKLFIESKLGGSWPTSTLWSNSGPALGFTSQSGFLNPRSIGSYLSFFFYGLGNSFFISIPGSIGTLIILRRVILQGKAAGFAATIGTIVGNCFVMIFVQFGSRFLVLSPVFIDISFYLSLLIPGYIILRAICFSYFRIIPRTDTTSLVSIGFVHLLLTLSNQSTLFKHLRNLTITPTPTKFLGISDTFFQILYALGFSVGCFIFALTGFFFLVFLINWWLTKSTMTRSRLMNLSENTSIVLLTALTISTVSYYGTDFLLAKSFGFLPTDKAFSDTVLAPNTVFKDPHNLTGVHALYPSNEFSLDPAPFDRPLEKLYRRCILLKQPNFKYRSFEELNYQGEKHWLHRGFRHGSAKPIKTVTLPGEKNKLAKGRALLRSLDKAIGWVDEEQNSENSSKLAFTNLAKEDIDFNFSPPLKGLGEKEEYLYDLQFLEQRFKRLFFGQIGLLPGRLPPIPYGPFDSQEMAHKRLAFNNPVYKALLSFDIDLFLKRQPAFQSLSAEDEHNIYLKRQLLERYINTQRDYFENKKSINFLNQFTVTNLAKNKESINGGRSKSSLVATEGLSQTLAIGSGHDQIKGSLPSKNEDIKLAENAHKQSTKNEESKTLQNSGLSSALNNPERLLLTQKQEDETFFVKSLANQTYKHQFKGTLEIVRQMFAVSLDSPNSSSLAGGGNWEKLTPKGKNFFKDDKALVTKRPKNPRILKYDQPLYILKDKNAFKTCRANDSSSLTPLTSYDHEELCNKKELHFGQKLTDGYSFNNNQKRTSWTVTKNQDKASLKKPFLESTLISPFYIGWDNQRRQLLLTQRYLARKEALNFNTTQTEMFVSKKDKVNKLTGNKLKSAVFTTWPILKPDSTDLSSTRWRIPSRSFEHMVALEEEARMGVDEPSDKNKGLKGSYENFVELWNKQLLGHETFDSTQKSSFKLSRWPTNITTPSVQIDLDSFEQVENLFTGTKRGGFIWPGSTELKLKKNR